MKMLFEMKSHRMMCFDEKCTVGQEWMLMFEAIYRSEKSNEE